MKLLLLTQYYPPEVGAPQNRLHELARHLKRKGIEVTVLTAMPNYPSMRIHEAYKGKEYCSEEIDGIEVHRSSIYVSESRSIVSRLRNYFSFVWSSARTGRAKLPDFDFILCESPPLFLGYAALYLARIKKAKLIFNVSDLWPESAEKLGVVTNRFFLGFAYRLEKRLYKRSVLVTGQTQGICKDIKTRFPSVPVYWLPNGVDLSYYDPHYQKESSWRQKYGIGPGDKVFLYAGIIGLAQGLEVIVQCAVAFRDKQNVKFVLMGSGPEKERLQEMTKEKNVENVIFIPPVPKSEMPGIVAGAYAAIIPLKKLGLFRGAIPSKIFENLAMQVPIVLGVDGEAKELFIDQGNCGLFFEPENVTALTAAIVRLIDEPILRDNCGRNGRVFVSKFFDRMKIADDFYERLKTL